MRVLVGGDADEVIEGSRCPAGGLPARWSCL